MTPYAFTIPPGSDLPALVADLAGGLHVAPPEARRSRVRYFDSFDWRLHRAERTLRRQDGTWDLQILGDGQLLARAPARPGPWPRFAADFGADSPLARPLARLLGIRALVHLVTAVCRIESWDVRNEDQKIVLRVAAETFELEKPAAGEPLARLILMPLRGYEEHLQTAARAAAARSLAATTSPLLDALLCHGGLTPRSYGPGFQADLAPDQSALQAFVTISRTLLRAMRQNEAGLRADLDTEFLHDYRVAVRRQRSALGHFRGVVQDQALAPFAARFKQLGRLTGPLRDIDVDLLERERSLGLLPDHLRPGLQPRYERLLASRATELNRLRRALAAPDYREFLAAWRTFLADPPQGELAEVPLHTFASARLRKLHQSVLRDGRAITPRSPDADLHRLRIRCKKLRYLIEFSRSLFPAAVVDELLVHLKGLQDNLGEFNDLSVQQADLTAALAAPDARGPARLAEAAALGGLLTVLAGRHREVRADFSRAFDDFAAPTVTRLFTRLYDLAEDVSA
ncbi:MAG: CHAD domain-containing protein [Candidatus Krumholzibacteriia bacterium]